MSRVGKQSIAIPAGTTVSVQGRVVSAKGAKGAAEYTVPECIEVKVVDGKVRVERRGEGKREKELHGTTRNRLANLIRGVTEGYQKVLEVHGVGYRAQVQGRELQLSLGGASPYVYKIPAGVEVSVEGATKIMVKGIDNELVGSVAAKIRSYYPPEPYKGKGIRYENEHVRRKAGKTAAG
ncbi:MAG: 50S ribosomal protein L6 [bacterium]|nr:50S ribosomal protein L6 [bacterium]